MKLSKQDADLFFQLMRSLQLYVNDKFKIYPDVNSIKSYNNLDFEDKVTLREKLFENPDLFEEYTTLNPDELAKENLSIIESWKGFIKDDFYIERYLKSHAIFISNEKVYAVLALYDNLEEIIHKSHLPHYSNTVLLPFKGKIIYDGVLRHYSISFGGGMKRSLKETYMMAKQNNRIISSLEEKSKIAKKVATHTTNWSQEIEELGALAKKLKGGSNQPAINSAVFSLIKSSIDLANVAVADSGEFNALHKELNKTIRSIKKIKTIIDRID